MATSFSSSTLSQHNPVSELSELILYTVIVWSLSYLNCLHIPCFGTMSLTANHGRKDAACQQQCCAITSLRKRGTQDFHRVACKREADYKSVFYCSRETSLVLILINKVQKLNYLACPNGDNPLKLCLVRIPTAAEARLQNLGYCCPDYSH